MDAKHTPGPWQSQDEGGVFLYDHPWSVENHEASTVSFTPVHRNGCVIALVVRTDWNDSQLERDARLIAASPDLLHALKALLAETTGPDEVWAEGSAVKHARAAIAKATGE